MRKLEGHAVFPNFLFWNICFYISSVYFGKKFSILKANPWKFQFMILGKKNRLKDSLKIWSLTIKESDKVELLGITIDKALDFKRILRIYVALPSTSFMVWDEWENTWH